MGLATPFYGPVFMHNLRLAPASVSIGSEGFRIRGVEAEYAFLIGEDLPKRGDNTEYSAEDVGDAVAAVSAVGDLARYFNRLRGLSAAHSASVHVSVHTTSLRVPTTH